MKKTVTFLAAAGFLAATLAATLVTGAALAAEMGRVKIDGRTIIIHDNNTWTYSAEEAAAVPSNCTTMASEIVPVSICLDPDEWTRTELSGDNEYELKRKGIEHYMIMITEKAELQPTALKEAILENAQNAAGLAKVETIAETSVVADGQTFEKIVYRTDVDGLDITYTNYYTMFPGSGSMQIVFFALTDDNVNYEPFIEQVAASIKSTQ